MSRLPLLLRTMKLYLSFAPVVLDLIIKLSLLAEHFFFNGGWRWWLKLIPSKCKIVRDLTLVIARAGFRKLVVNEEFDILSLKINGP